MLTDLRLADFRCFERLRLEPCLARIFSSARTRRARRPFSRPRASSPTAIAAHLVARGGRPRRAAGLRGGMPGSRRRISIFATSRKKGAALRAIPRARLRGAVRKRGIFARRAGGVVSRTMTWRSCAARPRNAAARWISCAANSSRFTCDICAPTTERCARAMRC